MWGNVKVVCEVKTKTYFQGLHNKKIQIIFTKATMASLTQYQTQ